MRQQIREAVAEATRRGKLRPNSVDSITGKNSGDNLGPGTPIIHFAQWERDAIEIKLILKGGGCENTNAQYALPVELPHLGRADRTLDDVNPDPRLAELEAAIMATVNDLEIGTMGFGGKVTLIGCKIGALNRLPASFFVSVAYDCWAFRRLGVELNAQTGAIDKWLYRDPSHPIIPMLDQSGFTRTGREVALRAPLTDEQVRALKVGDVVMISGRMFTGRDAVHSYLMKHEPPVDLRGSVLYHCGPVVVKEGDNWKVTAAGPTTSIREEPYQGEIIKRYGVRAVIGKGGMGAKTLAAMKEQGAVYLNAIGGAAQFYARAIKQVDGVSLMDFGTPEAMWHLTVEDFPAIVTMDAHGNSLHKDIEQESGAHLETIGV
jgi:fumarate hydratase class I